MADKITRFFCKLPAGPGNGGSIGEKRKPEQEIIVIQDTDNSPEAPVQKKIRSNPPPAQDPGSEQPKVPMQEERAAAVSNSSRNAGNHEAGSSPQHAIELLTSSPASPNRTHPAAANCAPVHSHVSHDLSSSTPAANTAPTDAPESRPTSDLAPVAMTFAHVSQPTAAQDDAAAAPGAGHQAAQQETSAVSQSAPTEVPVNQAAAAASGAAADAPGNNTVGPAADVLDAAAASAVALQGDRDQLLAKLSQELQVVQQALSQVQLLPCLLNDAAAAAPAAEGSTAGCAAAPRLSLSQTPELAAYLEGQACTLTQLLARLTAACGEPELTLRTLVMELATRKNYSAHKGSDSSVLLLADLDDVSPGSLWVWELRDLKKSLGGSMKAQKKLAEQQRKRRKDLHDRLLLLSNLTELLQQRPSTKAAEGKLLKMMQRLQKLPGLQQVEGVLVLQEKPAAVRRKSEGGSIQQKEADGRRLEADKAAKEAKEAEKAEREARQAAKEAERAAKEVERRAVEAEKAAKEAEKEKERAAKEAKKEDKKAAKTGFGDAKTLNKSATMMQRFIGITPSKGPGAGAVAAAAEPSTSAAAGTPAGSQGQLTPQQKQQQRAGALAAAGEAESASVLAARISEARCTLDASLQQGLSSEALPGYALELKARWKRGGEGEGPVLRKRLLGVPPTWARRPSCSLDPGEHLSRHYGAGAEWSSARVWRRKLLMFPKYTEERGTKRPPYYGSYSQKSCIIGPRKPLSLDTALLDYEYDSDEDWEEEPEGEDLGEGDAMEEDEPEAAPDAEEQGDGFMVDDGYLSDDEGVRDSQAGLGEAGSGEGAEAGEQAHSRALPLPLGKCSVDPRLQQLQAAIDRAAKSNRCLVLVRDRSISCEQSSGLDLQVLDVLAPVFLRSAPPLRHMTEEWGIYAHLAPPRTDAHNSRPGADAGAGLGRGGGSGSAAPGSTAAAAGWSGAVGPGRGRPAMPLPQSLAPLLLAFIGANGSLKIDQLVDGFISTHSQAGQVLSKKAVKAFIKDSAAYDHKAGAWRLKQEAGAGAGAAEAGAGAVGTPLQPVAAGAGSGQQTPQALLSTGQRSLGQGGGAADPGNRRQQPLPSSGQQEASAAHASPLPHGSAGMVLDFASALGAAGPESVGTAGASGSGPALDLAHLSGPALARPSAPASASKPRQGQAGRQGGIQSFFAKAPAAKANAGSAAAGPSSSPVEMEERQGQQGAAAASGPGTLTPVQLLLGSAAGAGLQDPGCTPAPCLLRAPANTPMSLQGLQGLQGRISPLLEAAAAKAGLGMRESAPPT